MNTAQDKKILNIYLQFDGDCIQKIFPEIKYLTKCKYISNLQRNNILQNKTKIKHNFHWLRIC